MEIKTEISPALLSEICKIGMEMRTVLPEIPCDGTDVDIFRVFLIMGKIKIQESIRVRKFENKILAGS